MRPWDLEGTGRVEFKNLGACGVAVGRALGQGVSPGAGNEPTLEGGNAEGRQRTGTSYCYCCWTQAGSGARVSTPPPCFSRSRSLGCAGTNRHRNWSFQSLPPDPGVMGPLVSHLLSGLCVGMLLGWVGGSIPNLGPAEQEQNHYLTQLFGLYGENGTLTAGGLGRLLHSLGLGRVQGLHLGHHGPPSRVLHPAADNATHRYDLLHPQIPQPPTSQCLPWVSSPSLLKGDPWNDILQNSSALDLFKAHLASS